MEITPKKLTKQQLTTKIISKKKKQKFVTRFELI